METHSYYAGCIGRKDIEKRLWLDTSSGNFLLRKNRKHGFYCISVRKSAFDFYHYRVNENTDEFGYGKKYDLFKEPKFNSVIVRTNIRQTFFN